MEEHDFDGRALLVVVGRDEQRLLEPDREGEQRRRDEPRHDALGEVQKPRRVGEVDESHGCLLADSA